MRVGITLTGADEQTPLRELKDLATRAGVEVGLLLTCNPEGRNRYPGRYWLEQAVFLLDIRCAVHVCGREARRLALQGSFPWLRHAGRLQINGAVSPEEVEQALRIVPHVITQHGARNPDLSALDLPGHCILVDGSGGRGLSPEKWVRPSFAPASKPVGFAGGLGPDNLAEELPRIAEVATGTWWVDMEGKLRGKGDDRFSLRKAHECVDIMHAWWRGRST